MMFRFLSCLSIAASVSVCLAIQHSAASPMQNGVREAVPLQPSFLLAAEKKKTPKAKQKDFDKYVEDNQVTFDELQTLNKMRPAGSAGKAPGAGTSTGSKAK